MTCKTPREAAAGISVIVPTRDEAEVIGPTIEALYARAGRLAVGHPGGSRPELIVADGGSGDDTRQIARSLGAVVVTGAPGRARQMNAGAAVATGEFLLFLHADTLLPVDYTKHIKETLAQPGVVAGAFQLGIDAPHRSLRVIEWCVNLRSRWLSLPYGDQGLFMRADTFRNLGGYADMPAMEDYELVRRLAKLGRIRLVSASVRTSARRWLHQGVVCATVVNQACIIGYHLGVNPCRLAAWRDRRCTHSRDTDRRGQDADSTHGRGGADRERSAGAAGN